MAQEKKLEISRMTTAVVNPSGGRGVSSIPSLGLEIIKNCRNKMGDIRLAQARGVFLDSINEKSSIPILGEAFRQWRDQDEYLLLQGENLQTGKVKHVAVKCSKRGNDVFTRRLDSRLGFLYQLNDVEMFSPSDFDKKAYASTNLLFVTLTYDPKVASRKVAWEGQTVWKVHKRGKNKGKQYLAHRKGCVCINCNFNRWITRLRKKYGRINVFRTLEAFPDPSGSAFGYPHPHLVLHFLDHSFNAFPTVYDKRDGSTGFCYRVKERDEIKKVGGYPFFSDIKAVSSGRSLGSYLRKHTKNTHEGDTKEALVTQSMLWLTGKRTFSLSKGFAEKLTEFIYSMHNSNRKMMQKTLDGGVIKVWDWTFWGVVSAERLGVSGNDWSMELDKEVFDKYVQFNAKIKRDLRRWGVDDSLPPLKGVRRIK